MIEIGKYKSVLIVALGWLCLLCGVHDSRAQRSDRSCTHPDHPEFYVREKYKIRKIRIENIFRFFPPLPRHLIQSELPIKAGDDFSLEKRDEGRKKIEEWLKEAEKNADPQFRVQVITAPIANCQEAGEPRQLDVIYWIFTTNFNAYFTRTWELKNKEVQEPVTTAATNTPKYFIAIKPYLGYNRTRHLFGGTGIQMRLPKGVIDNFELRGAASSAGNEEELEISGSRAPELSFLNRFEYHLNYHHSDLPAGENRLREGKLHLQFFGATRPLGSKNFIARFGLSLEGGNQQTDLIAEADANQSRSNSGYGGLKAYLGTSWRSHRAAFSGSYGLQIGTRGASTDIDFIKHVGDISGVVSWFPKSASGEVHKVTVLETQFNIGKIQKLGFIPVAERFFGGNTVENFIPGDTWSIKNGPLIRSIPQNRLNASSSLGAIGATGFYSANFTLSRPIWGYPILPKVIAADPDFAGALVAAKETTRNILKDHYVLKLKLRNEVAAHAKILDPDLKNIIEILTPLPDELPGNFSDDEQESYATHRALAKDRAVRIRSQLAETEKLAGNLMDLIKNSDGDLCSEDPDECSFPTNVNRVIDFLTRANRAEASQLREVQDSLSIKYQTLLQEFQAVDVTAAVKLAEADMNIINPPLDAFVNELNIIAISPVAIFDVARIWPDRNGTRFGIGGGVKVTVVNFNVTLGYAVNPNPKIREGRGALFFKMDITNLFR